MAGASGSQMNLQPVISGERVNIRPLKRDDLDALYAVAVDPLIWEQHPAKSRCERATFAMFFQESLDSGGALAIMETAGGQMIGSSRYHGFSAEESVVEIGWSFLARAYWGGIYNREVKDLMLRHAFRYVQGVVFLVDPENLRSQRAVEKIGGCHVGYRLKAGNRLLVYRIDKDEYFSKSP